MKTLDLHNWKRKEHFDFFRQYDEPFFGMVSEIDCTTTFDLAKEKDYSFFACYLHRSIRAINEIEEFKYRIDDDKIIIYDEIHASATIGREDNTFGFSFIPFNTDFEVFQALLKEETIQVKNSTGLRLNKEAARKDVIHYSSIPWSRFTGLTHARNFKFTDSTPKITFGKTFSRGERMIMPIAINVHHGLLDGFHVAKYLELFQKLMDE